jgi:hypothetical protein
VQIMGNLFQQIREADNDFELDIEESTHGTCAGLVHARQCMNNNLLHSDTHTDAVTERPEPRDHDQNENKRDKTRRDASQVYDESTVTDTNPPQRVLAPPIHHETSTGACTLKENSIM